VFHYSDEQRDARSFNQLIDHLKRPNYSTNLYCHLTLLLPLSSTSSQSLVYRAPYPSIENRLVTDDKMSKQRDFVDEIFFNALLFFFRF